VSPQIRGNASDENKIHSGFPADARCAYPVACFREKISDSFIQYATSWDKELRKYLHYRLGNFTVLFMNCVGGLGMHEDAGANRAFTRVCEPCGWSEYVLGRARVCVCVCVSVCV